MTIFICMKILWTGVINSCGYNVGEQLTFSLTTTCKCLQNNLIFLCHPPQNAIPDCTYIVERQNPCSLSFNPIMWCYFQTESYNGNETKNCVDFTLLRVYVIPVFRPPPHTYANASTHKRILSIHSIVIKEPLIPLLKSYQNALIK